MNGNGLGYFGNPELRTSGDYLQLLFVLLLVRILSYIFRRFIFLDIFCFKMVANKHLSYWDTCWCQAYALLYDSVNKEDLTIRIGAIMGLGLAYAGSQKEEVRNSLLFITIIV